jgi:hypothetical protein
MRRPLSEIIKEMSCTVLNRSDAVPSSEAAHAALLLAHVAWNRAEAIGAPSADYGPMLREFKMSKRDLWNELKLSDAESPPLGGFDNRNHAIKNGHAVDPASDQRGR